MHILLFILSVAAFGLYGYISANARSSDHEILAVGYLIVASVLLGSAGICEGIKRTNRLLKSQQRRRRK